MLVWDARSVVPALDGGVIAMAQLASHRADAAAVGDDLCVSHGSYVRIERTLVNVENVRTPCEGVAMSTIGEKLTEIRSRVEGLSLDDVAAGGGYKGRSSVQRYFDDDYNGPLAPKIAKKLAKGLAPSGATEDEIMALAETGVATNAVPFAVEGSSSERMRENLPVYGSALGAEKVVDGQSIEQTYLNTGSIVEYRKRPTILNGRKKVYGLYVQGASMSPAHEDGSIVLAERDRPLKVGDSVVVYLRANGEGDFEDDGESARSVLVKRLVRRTAQYVELMQFEPRITFKIPASDVLRIDRVFTLDDLLD